VGKDTKYRLYDKEDGSPCGQVNVPYLGQSETVIAVKDYSENEGMVEFLEDNGVILSFVGFNQGFPVFEIDKEVLLAL
jgi:hypothetical protein